MSEKLCLEKINLRPVEKTDVKALLEIYGPYVLKTAISYEQEIPSEEDFINRIEKITKKFPYIVAEYEGKIIGYIYASTFHERKSYDRSVETSIYVDSEFRGMGLGSILYNQLKIELKKMNVTNLYACIAATSRSDDKYLTDGSIRFHEKIGFKLVGRFCECAEKFGLLYDMVYMEMKI